MLIKFRGEPILNSESLILPHPLDSVCVRCYQSLGGSKGTLAGAVLGKEKTEVYRGKNTHTQWMPAESKTGQDSSGLIRQRTHELKSGGGNMTFFSSLSVYRDYSLASEITWREAGPIMDCQRRDSL